MLNASFNFNKILFPKYPYFFYSLGTDYTFIISVTL